MKNKKKGLIIAAIAALVLVGVMILLIFLPKGDTEVPELDGGVDITLSTNDQGVHQVHINTDKNGNIENNSYGSLITYAPRDITKIHVENAGGSMDIKSYTPKKDDGSTEATVYTFVGYEDFELQTGIPDQIANAAAKIEFAKVVSLKAEDAKDYGFEKPAAVATVYYSDNTSAVIYVGNNAPQGAGTYVKFGDGDEIYLVEETAVSAFLYKPTDLISHVINDAPTNTENSLVKSIYISGTNFAKPIELKANTNTNNSASFVISQPQVGYASENESSIITGDIRGLYATGVAMVNPSNSQLNKLGLSKPYAQIKAVYPDATIELIASKPDKNNNVNLMVKGGNIVYTIESSSVAWVTTSYEKLLNEYVFHPKMTALSSLSVNNGEKTYDFKLSSKQTTTTDDEGNETTSTTTTIKCGSEEINDAYFATFFQNLTLMEISEISLNKPSGSPAFTVTYSYADGAASDTVKFYANGTKYLAEVNGNSVGTVYKSSITKLAKQVEEIASNKEVESFA